MPNKESTTKSNAGTHTEVFDQNFKFLYEVPSHLVVHMPLSRLKVKHLVVCRNYKPNEPSSCVMGNNCKFVHADVDVDQLEAQPVHVNYIWRHEDLCTYNRLQPGEQLEVLLPNNRQPAEMIPSECILSTQGAIATSRRRSHPLSHCAHYYFNGVCNRGEGCSFVHTVCVDPNVRGEFKRATGRPRRHRANLCVMSGDGKSAARVPSAMSPTKHALEVQIKTRGSAEGGLSCAMSLGPLPIVMPIEDMSSGSSEGPILSQSISSQFLQDDWMLTGVNGMKCGNVPPVSIRPRSFPRSEPQSRLVYRHDPYRTF